MVVVYKAVKFDLRYAKVHPLPHPSSYVLLVKKSAVHFEKGFLPLEFLNVLLNTLVVFLDFSYHMLPKIFPEKITVTFLKKQYLFLLQ